MTLRLAVVCDYLEEGWPSMDLVAEMLVAHARDLAEVDLLRPALPRLPGLAGEAAWERAFGRYVHYPSYVLARRRRFDAFHLADHSYAHLALALPARRVGVYCHDLEAFRATFPDSARAGWRRRLAELLLAGLRRARVVFYSTSAVRDEIIARRLLSPELLVHAPYGVCAEFTPRPDERDRAWAEQGDYVLHVGSLVPRKNPDFLLELFSKLAAERPQLKLVQVGGEWSVSQLTALASRGLAGRVIQRRGISRHELAAIYRRARALLLPSKVEGFGLPVIEALACGTPVVASDLAVLREVGGSAATYCQVDDMADWAAALTHLLASPDSGRESRLAWASRFAWSAHARTIVAAYRALS